MPPPPVVLGGADSADLAIADRACPTVFCLATVISGSRSILRHHEVNRYSIPRLSSPLERLVGPDLSLPSILVGFVAAIRAVCSGHEQRKWRPK